ncbi:MAG TPA: fumarylacetoacetate hydrolase family protein [Acidimicrobiales bacterium]|jgi:2-keto-4-pentenoate hydratase/2-oxohepta-3-ene-1,7-dioic acid hydratase in catechol pathway|nr:fumarylacetoacetate hydrolase family protein [Acidimicrobiales bacterium]
MKFVRVGELGRERAGVLGQGGEILRLPEELGDIDASFFHGGREEEVRRLLDANALDEVVGESERIGSPIAKPEKIVCIGLNYRDHARETRSPIPDEPIIFMKAPNCVVGPNDEVLVPRGSVKTDWEVELGVVIGTRARYLESPDGADDFIAGYCVSHDVSEREFQLERGGQWDKGKSCETFNPLGPWLVTRDEIVDPQNLRLRLSVNGVERQNGTTADMIFGVNHLVWYLSQFMVLEPGDLINTGTPAGVSLGHDDVPFLHAGDVTELSIDGLGSQRSRIGQA